MAARIGEPSKATVAADSRGLEALLERAAPIARPEVELFEGDLLREGPCDCTDCSPAAMRQPTSRPLSGPVPLAPTGSNTTAALRTEGTRWPLEAVLAAHVPRYLQQGLTTAYPDEGDRWFDESTPFDQSGDRAGASQPIITMERLVRAFDPTQVAWMILRGGSFVDPGTNQDAVIAWLRGGSLRVPGDVAMGLVHPRRGHR